MDGFHNQLGQRGLAQKERTGAGIAQQSVHDGELLTCGQCVPREAPIGRQAAIKPPREEDGILCLVDVRKPPAVEGHVERVVGKRRRSQAGFEWAGAAGTGVPARTRASAPQVIWRKLF